MNKPQEHEEKRHRFLQYLCENEWAQRNGMFESLTVGNILGYSEVETDHIARHLIESELIEYRGGSGQQKLIRLTLKGRGEARTELLGPGIPADTADVHAPQSDVEFSVTRGLTPGEKNDYDKYGFKCRDRIYITGEFDNTGRNIIGVNDTKVPLGHKQLNLLLVFVAASKNIDGGWVDPDVLVPLRLNPPNGKYQVISVLRQKLQPGLVQSDPMRLFEKGYCQHGIRRYRLSTHPDFVTYDRDKLLRHPDNCIKEIAKGLPDL